MTTTPSAAPAEPSKCPICKFSLGHADQCPQKVVPDNEVTAFRPGRYNGVRQGSDAPKGEPTASPAASLPAASEREGEADRARFEWFFGPADKIAFMNTYMEGMRKSWTAEQWRIAIDAQRLGREKENGNG